MATMIAERGVEPWRRRLYLPAYAPGDAARYSGVAYQRLRGWNFGGGEQGPVLPGRQKRDLLSYLQLVEVAFVATFRMKGVSMPRIRRARDFGRQVLNSEYPFAQYRWKTNGAQMLLDLLEVEPDAKLGESIVGDSHGQIGWDEMLLDRFGQFDYVDDLALVWHVAGRESPVLIDPRVSFGAPAVDGTPTWVIKGRWEAGESIEDIEEDFEIDRDVIARALEFEDIQVPS